MKLLSGIVVAGFGLCLIALAAMIVIKPLALSRGSGIIDSVNGQSRWQSAT